MEKKHYCKQTPKGEPLHCDFGFCHSCNSLPPVTPPIMEEKVGIEGIIYVLNNFRHDPDRIAKTELYAKELLRLLNTEPTLSPDAMMLTENKEIGKLANIIRSEAEQAGVSNFIGIAEAVYRAGYRNSLSLQKLSLGGEND